jgi:hypothetical protein
VIITPRNTFQTSPARMPAKSQHRRRIQQDRERGGDELTNAQREAIAEADLTRDRPAVQRSWNDPATPNRQTIYATWPATPRGVARVRVTL